MSGMMQRQRSALRLIHDAGELASSLGVSGVWRFEEASDAIANDDFDEAEIQLACIDETIDNESVRVPARDAWQLVIAILERRSA